MTNASTPAPQNTSYPSGHSTESALWAEILSTAFPEKVELFETQVQDTMWSRIVGGVHYPSDTQAGLILGKEIARQMLANEDMQAALTTIRAETAKLQGPQSASTFPSLSPQHP